MTVAVNVLPMTQYTRLVSQFTASPGPAGTYREGQPATSVSVQEMPVAQPTGLVGQYTVDAHKLSETSSREMSVLQPVRPASKTTATQ